MEAAKAQNWVVEPQKEKNGNCMMDVRLSVVTLASALLGMDFGNVMWQ
jgi:hypothetical protein